MEGQAQQSTPATPAPEEASAAGPREIAIPPSQNLARVAYDDKEMTLWIQFQRGPTYQYLKVPANVADGFANSGSRADLYFRQNIKDAGFEYSRVS